jgi:putative DNA primase/helicase
LIDLNDIATAPVRYDLDAIVQRLRATAHAWVPGLFPNGRREGNDWRLANINGDPPRNNGSCVIALTGEHAGDWHDFDGDQGGGPLSTLSHGTRLADRALYAHAADMTGWNGQAPPRQEPAAPPRAPRDASHEITFIRTHAMPIVDTAAERYLVGRGLAVPPDADLLFHSDLAHFETRAGYPGMVGLVRDQAGEVVAVHRTYLQDNGDGVRKADIAKARMMLGKSGRGTVRLAPIGADGFLGLSEGIETGLAVMTACPGLPVWAALSTSGMEQVHLPPEARHVFILADNDPSGAGLRAAETLLRRLQGDGRRAAIILPPEPGDDFNDMLLRDGASAVAALVRAAATRTDEADGPQDTPVGRHLPIGFQDPGQQVPQLRADEGDLKRAVNRTWVVLYGTNNPPWLFRAGGLPSWVIPDDEGRPTVAMLNDERLRHMLALVATWRKINRQGELVAAPPPTGLVKSLLATPDTNLPVLAGIVSTPVFGRNGTLLTEPGYHPDARLLYHAAPGFTVPPIPDRPTDDQIVTARTLILYDLLGEFPFVSAAERAHAVALLLLGFLRAMIDGPTPLHLIEKPTPGTGATLMVDAIATILTGAGASVMTEGRDDEEWRKRITAKLRQIPSLILIDNLRNELDSSALAAALTAPFWEDRILGVSEMARLPIRCTWIATGNNPAFSNEMSRRLVRIRLDARVDQPWRRDGFRHPDLMGWVRSSRGKLVAACLTLCQAWIAAGRPHGQRSIGSYENWAQTIGGVLETVGIEGFLGNLNEALETADAEGGAWRAFVQTWWDRFGTAEVGVADLFELAVRSDPAINIGDGSDRSQRTRFGMLLPKVRDRVFQIAYRRVRAELGPVSHKARQWRLQAMADHDEQGQAHGGGSAGNLGANRGTSISKVPLENSQFPSASGEPGEPGEPFSTPTHVRGRAYASRNPEKGSPGSPRSPDVDRDYNFSGEPGGEPPGQGSPPVNPPSWLDGVP